LDIFYEFNDIHSISKDNLDDIVGAISKLASGLSTIETALKNDNCDNDFTKVFGSWAQEANAEINSLQEISTKVQNDYKSALAFFGEGPATKSDQFFSALSQFAKAIEQCLLENARQREEEEKEKRRAEEEVNKPEKGKAGAKGGASGSPQMIMPSQGQLDKILSQMKQGNAFKKRGSIISSNKN